VPLLMKTKYGYTFGSDVFFSSPPRLYYLIREICHVWQYQHGKWFGLHGPTVFFEWFSGIMSSGVLKYEEGLQSAADKVKDFDSFNKEQQAQILVDYWVVTTNTTYSFSSNYISLLKRFATQVLQCP